MIDYQALDAGKNEIRLLYHKRDSSVERMAQSRGVEFELRHVSLNDYIDGAHQFVHDTTSRQYSVKDYESRDNPEYDWQAVESDTFRAREIKLNPLPVTQSDPGRWNWGDYTTLSYTWGDAGQTRPMTVNGFVMQVTTNLHDFLSSYTRSDASTSRRMGLWIDAICINQSDVEERNVQVCRMGEIYSGALGTILWLGSASDGSDKAMDLLKSFEPYSIISSEEDLIGTRSAQKWPVSPTGSWLALYRLITRPYWTRLWICQEIALSQESFQQFRIVCGDRHVSWACFATMVDTCSYDFDGFMTKLTDDFDEEHSSTDFGDDEDLAEWSNVFERIQDLCRLGTPRRKMKEVDLTRLLALSRSSEQSDSKDKVYGILGLVNNRLSAMVTPDYKLSTTEIFKQFVRAAICSSSSLDIITCQGLHADDRALPSWMPDMTEKAYVRSDMTDGVPYRASQDTTAVARFHNDDLIVQGFLIDRIDGRGSRYSHHNDEREKLIQSTHLNNPYGDQAGLQNAIWRTLLADRDNSGNMLTESCRFILDTPVFVSSEPGERSDNMFKTGFTWMCEKNSDLQIGGQKLGSFFTHTNDDGNTKATGSKLPFDPFARIHTLSIGRLLITTTRGYLGQARVGVEKGDLVFILLGCSVPVILRPCADDKSYQLIGEAYVHGIMDGEAMGQLEAGEYSLEEMCIR